MMINSVTSTSPIYAPTQPKTLAPKDTQPTAPSQTSGDRNALASGKGQASSLALAESSSTPAPSSLLSAQASADPWFGLAGVKSRADNFLNMGHDATGFVQRDDGKIAWNDSNQTPVTADELKKFLTVAASGAIGALKQVAWLDTLFQQNPERNSDLAAGLDLAAIELSPLPKGVDPTQFRQDMNNMSLGELNLLKQVDDMQASRQTDLNKALEMMKAGFVPMDTRTQTDLLPSKVVSSLYDTPPKQVSLDRLLYGGLVESRHTNIPKEGDKLPDGSTVSKEAAALIQEKLNAETEARTEALLQAMPPVDTASIVLARWDAHYREANMKAIDKVLDAIEREDPPRIDFLSIGLDDFPHDNHGMAEDIERLKARIEASPKLKAHVQMIFGVDDQASMNLARDLIASGRAPAPKIMLASSGDLSTKGYFDGVDVRGNVDEHLKALGAGEIVTRPKDANLIAYVVPPDQDLDGPTLDRIADDLKTLMAQGKPVALSDNRMVNGIEAAQLIEGLTERGVDLRQLAAYASWGSVGNSIGSLIPDAVVGSVDAKTGAWLRDYHLVHDGLYLGSVADQHFSERNTRSDRLDPETAKKVEGMIKDGLNAKLSELGWPLEIRGVDLPWDRGFEANLSLKTQD